jgi:hypothetical protein
LNRPICGWNRNVQKLPTPAGDSIIGSRITVVHRLWPRNLRLMSNARPNPISTSNRIDQKTKCAVVCIAAHISGSVSRST